MFYDCYIPQLSPGHLSSCCTVGRSYVEEGGTRICNVLCFMFCSVFFLKQQMYFVKIDEDIYPFTHLL